MSKIIIIGAGASGLMASYLLTKAGHNVTLLEAQERLGGRIHSLHAPGFSVPVEMGAEFIHGKLPVTLSLMKEANIPTLSNNGTFWNADDGILKQGYGAMSGWGTLEAALAQVNTDMSIDEFLDKYLSAPEQTDLRMFVKGFAEGYDAADTSRMSTFAFRDELMAEESEQFAVEGGYSRIIAYLAEGSKKAGCEIILSAPVIEIKWSKGYATAITENGSYTAQKVILTIPAGVLQASSGKGVVTFNPPIPEKQKLFQSIGYGNAMKVFLQFHNSFWKQNSYVKRFGKKIQQLGFIVSDAVIPVWWTQYAEDCAMLTGWIGGPRTAQFASDSDEDILQKSLESISYIFGTTKAEIEKELKAFKVIDWAKNPYERGGYTYATVDGMKLRSELGKPVEDTLYFAGEAFYHGPEMGTVEAALVSGKEIAELILA